MKAHINLPKAEKKAIEEYNDKVQNETFNRYVKLSAVILHEKFKFGHDRIADFLIAMSNIADKAQQDEIFWEHIDDVLIKELKFGDFERENYEEMDK